MQNVKNWNNVKNWYEPYDELRGKISFVCEMSREEVGFLCGIIKENSPKKILEIGVAEGGTTGIILTALKKLHLDESQVYSIDISKKFYRDPNKTTGYETERIKSYINYKGEHRFCFDRTVAGWMEEIGAGIDLVIIDTTHWIPGELLDFISVFPFLAQNAVVVLHDVNLNYLVADTSEHAIGGKRSIATKVLFSIVVADKLLNGTNANIAAFKLNELTKSYLNDIFYALTINWSYMPDEWILEEYRNLFEKHYDEFQLDLYENAIENNKKMYFLERSGGVLIPYDRMPKGSRIIIYAAGAIGKIVKTVVDVSKYYKIEAWVDKNYENLKGMIESPRKISEVEYDYILVAVEYESLYLEIKEELIKRYNCEDGQIVGPIKRKS